ncbi:hypothetical protein P153DRAFT_48801 [Dothidotthia symphoricarpi CBS 119687]|uniref:Uncharacterized protein n=1 Tax=Dothidotthia symphoricarpi CBS 119687 TaxID=1392245 RepID=A0A6A6AAF5_9PLEO|nr:uncharacterized protein P153DRAFT_48801 [Dothidotthia symphoricarpi CBS 119687]KAF2128135.1 hypothetical protein P153DRAFT_48801 [Dothidotthia symphoricarpi CBS 119687]
MDYAERGQSQCGVPISAREGVFYRHSHDQFRCCSALCATRFLRQIIRLSLLVMHGGYDWTRRDPVHAWSLSIPLTCSPPLGLISVDCHSHLTLLRLVLHSQLLQQSATPEVVPGISLRSMLRACLHTIVPAVICGGAYIGLYVHSMQLSISVRTCCVRFQQSGWSLWHVLS